MPETLFIYPIKAFTDNYIWCIFDSAKKTATIVDPGDAKPVIDYLEENQLTLETILITHHHYDHTNGVQALVEKYQCDVYAGSQTPLKGVGVLPTNTRLTIMGVPFQVFPVPGHTLDHIAYFSAADEHHSTPWLFSGDTLFSGGCGRLFEGTAEQMLHSLDQLCELPDNTEIYATHEYTEANMRFAASQFPENVAVSNYRKRVSEQRMHHQSTLPTTLALEKSINPFVNAHNEEWQDCLNLNSESHCNDALSFFTEIRKRKDHF